MEPKNTFACVINCMDGRCQNPVKNYLQEHYGVDFVDMVTEPGPNKILADNQDSIIVENIKKRVGISVQHHGSNVVAIVGHFSCAGNPVEKAQQLAHLQQAKKTVEGFGFPVETLLLWVDKDWQEAHKIEAA